MSSGYATAISTTTLPAETNRIVADIASVRPAALVTNSSWVAAGKSAKSVSENVSLA